MLNQEYMQIARNTCRIIDFGIGSTGKKGQYQNSKYKYIAKRDKVIYEGSAEFVSIQTKLEKTLIRAVPEWVKQDPKRTLGWKITRVDN